MSGVCKCCSKAWKLSARKGVLAKLKKGGDTKTAGLEEMVKVHIDELSATYQTKVSIAHMPFILKEN